LQGGGREELDGVVHRGPHGDVVVEAARVECQPVVASVDSLGCRHQAIGLGAQQGLDQAQAAKPVFEKEGDVAVIEEGNLEKLALQPAGEKGKSSA
jgi:hypothetical protein